MNIEKIWNHWPDAKDFSGVFSVNGEKGVLFEIDEAESYGLGVYRYTHNNETVYYAVGGDFGVDFFTAYFPKHKIVASALGNTELNTFPLLKAMLSEIDKIVE